ncbi:MAG: phosphatase [Bacteroidota bacterium]
MSQPAAIIDLGTNTFHLLIAEPQDCYFSAIHKESLVMKIGQGGISQGLLTGDAYQRTIEALAHFRQVIDQHGVSIERVFATATSAIRNARNGAQLVRDIEAKTGIRVEIINGDKEAEYIYQGVKASLALGQSRSLIMDIGGGSVECIIGNDTEINWKQSFEIGAQRLLDLFVSTDPISSQSITALNDYLAEKLIPLTEAVRQYQPQTLVGSSGSFDTLAEIHYLSIGQEYDEDKQTAFSLPIQAYFQISHQLLTFNQQERLQIPGISAMRVDMIVVASCLINFALQQYPLQAHPIRVSSYALKEGVMQSLLS